MCRGRRPPSGRRRGGRTGGQRRSQSAIDQAAGQPAPKQSEETPAPRYGPAGSAGSGLEVAPQELPEAFGEGQGAGEAGKVEAQATSMRLARNKGRCAPATAHRAPGWPPSAWRAPRQAVGRNAAGVVGEMHAPAGAPATRPLTMPPHMPTQWVPPSRPTRKRAMNPESGMKGSQAGN